MTTENRAWGYTRLQGALANLHHRVARATIANILRRHGIEPAPDRQKRTTWREFLTAHWDILAAADFFTVEVWTAAGPTRFAVLFVIELATRRVEIAGIVAEPDSAWVTQCGRRVTDVGDGCLRGKRFLLHDRDPLFTAAFRETLAAAGVRTVRLPPRSPNLNAYAERFVRTIKESCLNRMILVDMSRLDVLGHNTDDSDKEPHRLTRRSRLRDRQRPDATEPLQRPKIRHLSATGMLRRAGFYVGRPKHRLKTFQGGAFESNRRRH